MTMIFGSGALIGLDRADRAMWVRLKGALLAGDPPLTHAGVLGQVWRGGPRQARLATALAGMDVRALDETLGRACGELLVASGQSDVIDAGIALLAADGDEIITSDPRDLTALAAACGRHVELVQV
jgi:hypothetical protein